MKYTGPVFGILFFLFAFFFLQYTSEYHFYIQEQNQLFQNNGDYVCMKLQAPGGVSAVLAEYLVQFFYLSYMGAFLTAVLLTVTGLLTRSIVKALAPEGEWPGVYLLPSVMLLFIHFSFNYFVAGTVAYIWMLLFFRINLFFPKNSVQVIGGLISAVLLFWIGGAITFLFTGCWLFYLILYRIRPFYSIVGYGLLAIGLLFLSTWHTWAGEYRFIFLPDAYFQSRLVPEPVIYFSWVVFPVILFLAFLLRNRKKSSLREDWWMLIPQVLLIAGVLVWGIPTYIDKNSAMIKKLDYFSRTQQWDRILESCEGPLTNYLYIALANRALAEKGELADRIFEYDQKGVHGLIVAANKTHLVSVLLSDLYYTIGDVAFARQMAFEANLSALGDHNPRMIQRLVETNLIFGAYPVAEKYIYLLEQTKAYKSWATQHRRFLYSDEAVAADPVLGRKRLGIPENYIMPVDGYDVNLQRLVKPAMINKNPVEYLGCLYLLLGDMMRFKELIETYYGTDVLPTLPRSFQEAVITLSETDPDYWQTYDIPEAVMERFMVYKKQVLANKSNPGALPGLLRRSFGDTYWYYFMFKLN
ncbi:MAG: DUF6057 family protein [Tannerellaceae bacterium]|nr:DUF6057 family protein [Tannerellaceae bacterium]